MADVSDLDDLPVVGEALAVLSVLADLILSGGDVLVVVVWGVLDSVVANIDLLLPLVSTLNRVAERIEWLPADALRTVFTVVLVVAVAHYAARFIGAAAKDSDE